MDMSILLHASITLMGLGLLFYYFKNRMSVTEQKVNLMFQLIQEHEKQSAMRVLQPQHMFQENLINEPEIIENKEQDLINVSDDEVSDDNDCNEDSEDSEECEDSDDDSDDQRLVYGETLDNPGSEKIIKLNLTGSETTNETNLTETNEPDNVTATLLEHSTDNDELENISLSENTDIDEDNVDENDEQEEADDQFQTNGNNQKLDYKKATVAQLKELCQSKNLSGYKNLRKPALIQLLESS
jgi:hypothetical protein